MRVNLINSICLWCLLQLVASIVVPTPGQFQVKTDTRISGRIQLRQLRQELSNCFRTTQGIWPCFRTRSLRMVEHVLAADVIPLYDGVRLIANAGPVRLPMAEERMDLKHQTWFDQLAMSLARGLTTHTLQINLGQVTESLMSSWDRRDDSTARIQRNPHGSARSRRHRYNMIITMMFGVTALGALLVPMGFQMLSIVSGKALLLSKMALLLASINGLKRVANSGLHYGLYHTPGEHLGGYYDRGDVNHPRNVPIPLAVSPSIDMGLK